MPYFEGLKNKICLEEGYIEKASAKNLDSKTANKGTNNYTKYSRDVNNNGLMGCQAQPWCGTFQFATEMYEFGKDEALKNWGMNSKNYVGYNCFATYNAFKSRGKVGMTPKLGALVIFNFSHMGRVLDIYSRNGRRYYHCAEGNTSANLNDRNGGQVKIKERLCDDLSTVKGFCYIDYSDTLEEKPRRSGWVEDSNGWKIYLGNTGEPVRNDWYLHTNGRYTWSDGAGYAIHDTWYKYKKLWYYFAGDCYMISSQWLEYKGEQYYLTADGSMATNAYIKSKDPKNPNMYYWVNGDGKYDPEYDAENPDLSKYKIAE